ncbi:hypothetical protein [Paenibacillus xylaniclasticus]|uniref:hypothetical protein n=1 Tax=Paenibacillus xylaniclasticus TaxID=588083 RepID=UPI000FD79793|nr:MULTISPECIES: hypothetical protein [Paenibacillus]GFN30875.1 hypothetical protein PCURB6_11350 [Paenibacillus curdlanolyticus]
MVKEWKQFWAQPQYWSLFVGAEIIVILVTQRLLSSWQDIPGMIFFIMAFNMLFLLFGTEQARLENKHHTAELISSLPKAVRYYGAKLLFWLTNVALWYLLFVATLLISLELRDGTDLSVGIVRIILAYTFCNWYIPFLVFVIIGYSLFTIWPSIGTYVILAAVWILLSPYNHFIHLLPSKLSQWLAISDINFEHTLNYYVTEHMIINDGVKWQRLLAVMVSVMIYCAAVSVIRKMKMFRLLLPVLLLLVIMIPMVAPSQQVSDIGMNMSIESNSLPKSEYVIHEYQMDIRHERRDHSFSYTADLSITANSNTITFALWKVIHINNLSWNGTELPYERQGNWTSFTVPNGMSLQGTLHLETSSEQYSDVNASSFELLPTMPWYPMHPEEAEDPMGNAKKEQYRITVHTGGTGKLITNLSINKDGILTGEAYGPTLLKAHYVHNDSTVRLIQYDDKAADQRWKSVTSIVDRLNKETHSNLTLPKQVYYVASRSMFSANPDEAFLKPLPVSLEASIRQRFYGQS